MKRYLYIAGAILVAIILIESLRLISIRMAEDNKFRKFIEKNRTILILLASIILSVISFAIFELRGAPPETQYTPAEIEDGRIKKGGFESKDAHDG